MNTAKVEKKKLVKPKSEATQISYPFDFRHDIHIGQEGYERPVDVHGRPVSPPAPCSSRDCSDDNTFQINSVNISQLLKEEIIPALRHEISDVIDKKLTRFLYDRASINHHCSGCTCSDDESQSGIARTILPNYYEDTSHDYLETDTIPIFGTPTPVCMAQTPDEDHIIRGENVQDQAPNGVKVLTATDVQDSRDETNSMRSISNPVYHHRAPTLLVYTQQGTKLVKYGSEMQLVHKPAILPDKPVVLSRANTLPGLTKNPRSPAFRTHELHTHRGRLPSKADERECMANALQWHIEDLLDSVVFKDSELPDYLLADGCLTEDECAHVRKKLDRKDQIRVLISLIKGRDIDILKRFLKHIKSHNVTVAELIWETFEINKKAGMRCFKCTLCKLTTQVNLKYIVDVLWSKNLIDDGLFNLITETDKPSGAQGDLWQVVIKSLNRSCAHISSDVRHILGNVLTRKHHYHHLAQGVEWMIYTNGELTCRCEQQCNIIPAGSIMSFVSSMSPQTSESDVTWEVNSDTSLFNNQRENIAATEDSRDTEPQPIPESRTGKLPKYAVRTCGDGAVRIPQENLSTPIQSEAEKQQDVTHCEPCAPVRRIQSVKRMIQSYELTASDV